MGVATGMEGKLGNAVWTENDTETFLSTKATFKEHLRIHTEKAASRFLVRFCFPGAFLFSHG